MGDSEWPVSCGEVLPKLDYSGAPREAGSHGGRGKSKLGERGESGGRACEDAQLGVTLSRES